MYNRCEANAVAHPLRPDHRSRIASRRGQGSSDRPRPCRQSPPARARHRYRLRRARQWRSWSKLRQGWPCRGPDHKALPGMQLRPAAASQRMSSMRVQDICRHGGLGAGRRACRARVSSVRLRRRPPLSGMRQKRTSGTARSSQSRGREAMPGVGPLINSARNSATGQP
jgi:hypothetical protein